MLYRTFWKRQIYSDRDQVTGCKELAVGDEYKGQQPQGGSEAMDLLCIMTVVVGTEYIHFSILIELYTTE